MMLPDVRSFGWGHADLWVTDGLIWPLVAEKEHDIIGLKPVLVFRETPMCLAVSNETYPATVENLQQGLDKAKADEDIDAIRTHYQG